MLGLCPRSSSRQLHAASRLLAQSLRRHQLASASWRPCSINGLAIRLNSTSSRPSDVKEPTPPEPKKDTGFNWSNLLKKETRAEGSSSFLKIMSLAKPERKPLSMAVGLLFVSSAVSMSVPFTIGRLIDFFSASNPIIPFGLTLWQASGCLLLLFTTGAAANAGRAYLMRVAGQRIVGRLRQRTYSASLRQEPEYVERGEGDMLSRLNADTGIVGESVTQNLSDGLRAVIMSCVGLGAMFWVSPTLTFVMLSVVPPISLGAVFYGRYLKKLSNQTQEAVGEMTKLATQSLSSLRTVQAYNAAPQEEAQFAQKISKVLALARREAVASAIFFGSTGLSGNLTILCLLGYGGTLVSRGEISVGDLSSLLMYTVYVGSGLQMLTSFFGSIMRGIGAGVRVFEVLDREPAIPPTGGDPVPENPQGIIRFENIGFHYPSRPSAEILKDFSLVVNPGETVAVVGESGGGKSSIHSLLLRYYDPVHGRVTFDGRDIREFSTNSWRSIIGIVPQDPVLFAGTIASNIAYGNPGATRDDIEEAAREANCEFVWGMPDGFDTEIGRLSLSGGQRQRLAIARALLKKPRILALDEATSALDATSERRVNDAIEKILRSHQTTCLFVAHRLSTIARAQRIVVLEDGRIVESGTFQELVGRENSRFRTLMAAQMNAAAGETHKDTPEVEEEAEEFEEIEGKEDVPTTTVSQKA